MFDNCQSVFVRTMSSYGDIYLNFMPMSTHNFRTVDFDRALIESLPGNGPRYTSYPTADRFTDTFSAQDYIRALEQRASGALDKPLSLYIHIPFCNVICYYCGCNKIITKDKSRADDYLNYLEKETALLAPHLKGRHTLEQLHFGGGTPTFLSDEQLSRVFEIIGNTFELVDNGEYSIEIDPRKVTRDSVFNLAKLGFNRMSVGIQDFDPKVQVAVNRVQSEAETREVITAAREAGFKSVSVDLIYGLPHQSVASMEKTLDKVLELSPDRLALYHYAHLPHLFKPQRRIDTDSVPSSSEKLDILQNAVMRLTEAGYVFIGMDHFAKPEDELSVALRQGRLQRNFQGYSTYADCDLIGLGVSSIGKVGNIYCQNERDLEKYYQSIDQGHLPIMRGYTLNKDDILRRGIIQALMCRFALSFPPYEEQYGIRFKDYFAYEMEELKKMQALGLVEIEPQFLWVTNKGRFLIRNIAMIFDYHLRHAQTHATYSQTV